MTSSPAQIRELLLKSIDKDAKVVDTEGVLKAISALEKMTITKEALEGTRLGKLVNNIRKAASDAKLKDRCKRLIQKWKDQFVVKPKATDSSNATPAGQSKGKPTPKASSPRVSPSLSKSGGTPVDQTKSENRKRRKPESPTSPPDDAWPSKKQTIGRTEKGAGREFPRQKLSSEERDSSSSKSDTVPGRPRKTKLSKLADSGKESQSLHKQVLKSNATKVSGVTPSEQLPPGKVKVSKRSPKRGKHKRNGSASLSPSKGRETVDKDEEEPPYIEASPSPISITANSLDEDTIFTTEKQTEGTVDEQAMSPVPDSPAESAGSQDSSFSLHSRQYNQFPEKVIEDSSNCAEDRLADFEDIRVITEEHVRRIHEEHWEAVNGNYCSDGSWSSWQDCLVRDSGEDHSLHILPYVVID